MSEQRRNTRADRKSRAGEPAYNYRHFSIPMGGHVHRGVQAGEEAVDATLYTLSGNPVSLSERWQDRPIVLEFGSITCPIFTYKVDRMDELARWYDGQVDFYVVYTREAHPGQDYPGHRSFEEKLANAADARREESIERTILVDNLAGTMHRQYTPLPNAAYVIGTDGVVAHRADWVDPDHLEAVLSELLANDGRGVAVDPSDLSMNFQQPKVGLLPEFYRVFRRAGPGSLRDFLLAAPRMMRYRLRQRLTDRL